MILTALGMLWTIVGAILTTLAFVFKDGVYGGGPGMGPMIFFMVLTMVGPALIVWRAL